MQAMKDDDCGTTWHRQSEPQCLREPHAQAVPPRESWLLLPSSLRATASACVDCAADDAGTAATSHDCMAPCFESAFATAVHLRRLRSAVVCCSSAPDMAGAVEWRSRACTLPESSELLPHFATPAVSKVRPDSCTALARPRGWEMVTNQPSTRARVVPTYRNTRDCVVAATCINGHAEVKRSVVGAGNPVKPTVAVMRRATPLRLVQRAHRSLNARAASR